MAHFFAQKNDLIPVFAGTGSFNIPAVPPGLIHSYPLSAYHHTPAFDYEAPSPSHILGMIPFCSPSGVHSALCCLPRSHRPRLSWKQEAKLTHSPSSVLHRIAPPVFLCKYFYLYFLCIFIVQPFQAADQQLSFTESLCSNRFFPLSGETAVG